MCPEPGADVSEERKGWPQGDPIHPEGIWACEGCGQAYAEYINGCPRCWNYDLSREENLRRFPRRSVRLIVPESALNREPT
jgi:hypothetical protein